MLVLQLMCLVMAALFAVRAERDLVYFAAHAWQQLQWSCVCLTGLAPKNVLAIPSVIPSSWELLLQGDAGKCLHAVTHMHMYMHARLRACVSLARCCQSAGPCTQGAGSCMHVQLWRAVFHKLHLQCKNNLNLQPTKTLPAALLCPLSHACFERTSLLEHV